MRHPREDRLFGLRRARRGVLVGLLIGTACVSSSCYTQGETTCGQEDEPVAPLRGKVVDSASGQPLEGSLVFVELCKLYSVNPNPGKGHPNYRYGAIAAKDGSFEVAVPKGKVGLHTFLPGYRYGSLEVADSTAPDVVVRTAALLPGDPRPKVADFLPSAREVKPGESISFAVQVTASSPRDPISEEVLLLEPSTQVARAFDPPFRRGNDGFGVGFPSGKWSVTMNAPSQPGTYTYRFGMTSEQCIVSELLQTEITVR